MIAPVHVPKVYPESTIRVEYNGIGAIVNPLESNKTMNEYCKLTDGGQKDHEEQDSVTVLVSSQP